MNFYKLFLAAGSLFMALGVSLGAFGAHKLEKIFSEYSMSVYSKAVQYQFLHALGLIALAVLFKVAKADKSIVWSGWLFILGIFLFSGSLYAIAFTGIKKFGMITPFGGLAFIAGWILIAVFAIRS